MVWKHLLRLANGTEIVDRNPQPTRRIHSSSLAPPPYTPRRGQLESWDDVEHSSWPPVGASIPPAAPNPPRRSKNNNNNNNNNNNARLEAATRTLDRASDKLHRADRAVSHAISEVNSARARGHSDDRALSQLSYAQAARARALSEYNDAKALYTRAISEADGDGAADTTRPQEYWATPAPDQLLIGAPPSNSDLLLFRDLPGCTPAPRRDFAFVRRVDVVEVKPKPRWQIRY